MRLLHAMPTQSSCKQIGTTYYPTTQVNCGGRVQDGHSNQSQALQSQRSAYTCAHTHKKMNPFKSNPVYLYQWNMVWGGSPEKCTFQVPASDECKHTLSDGNWLPHTDITRLWCKYCVNMAFVVGKWLLDFKKSERNMQNSAKVECTS